MEVIEFKPKIKIDNENKCQIEKFRAFFRRLRNGVFNDKNNLRVYILETLKYYYFLICNQGVKYGNNRHIIR